MKNLYAAGLSCLLALMAFTSYSQVEPPLNQPATNKPSLFASLPEKFECSTDQLEKIFSFSPAQKISLKLNSAFSIEGILAEKFERSNHFTTINIKLSNYSDALFNLSRTEDKSGISYTGRIVSIKHSDALVLKKENGKYFFLKQQQQFLMVE
jgi:hypothetical protein